MCYCYFRSVVVLKANSIVIATFLLASLFSIVTVPHDFLWVRPEFSLLVLCYWVLALPEKYGVIFAFFVGLIQDIFWASVLGTHIFLYIISAALILFSYKRLRMMGVWQQAFLIFFVLLGSQIIKFFLGHFRIEMPIMNMLIQALIGALLWPWMMVALRGLRRKRGVTNQFI